jgi:iron complex transport system substrate-binding protein
MRVVSLVPSWTETLLSCGVEVVGRTRFCVHPEGAGAIPVVGGTKDLDLSKLVAIRPDLVLVDKEENLPWMAAEHGWKTHITHVSSAADMPGELGRLADLLSNERLRALGEEWNEELRAPFASRSVIRMPGLLEWIREPVSEPELILYLIWRNPWMGVSRDTFVGSMLAHAGYEALLPSFAQKYPKLELSAFDPARTLLLFSSEPYPFSQKRAELGKLGFPAALVDGEAYSWFGIRSLRFLQRGRADSP